MKFEEILDKEKYQVFLFMCPANIPINFARHSWLVVNRLGVISRWELFWRPNRGGESWDYLHKNFYAPTQGIEKYPLSQKYLWGDGTLLGYVEGDEQSLAGQMADLIESSPQVYPYCYKYFLTGPNSNTYVQWVLNQFPQSGLRLPWNCFGKDFKFSLL